MQIQVKNLTEVIVGLISLAGEIPRDIHIQGVADASVVNQINRLKKKQLIKHDAKHNRIRLRSPDGIDYLKNFSPDLYAHYMMISNNHQFQTGEKANENNRLFSECVLYMIQCGYQIDNLSILYRPNIFGRGEEKTDEIDKVLSGGLFDLGCDVFLKNDAIVPLEEAVALTADKKFFTSRYLKKGYLVTSRLNISAAAGMIVSHGNVYTVFFGRENGRLNIPSERAMNTRIRELYKYAFGEEDFEQFSKEYPKAIILTKNISAQVKRMESFENLFRNHYILPIDENGARVLDLLTSENWQPRIRTGLYGEDNNKICDGYFNNIPSWEILSCDFSKAKRVAKYSGNSKTNFICFKWQEKLVKTLTKNTNAVITTLTEDQENILFGYMLEKEK